MKISKIIIFLLFVIIILLLGNIYFFKEQEMSNFSKTDVSPELKHKMIKMNIWSSSCPVPVERLKLLKISYYDFDGNEHNDGKIMVFDVLADHVLSIFYQLHKNKFPIASINLINEYNGNDLESMKANNTSAFNCRVINNSDKLSIHSYGMAIDINPQQNPYLLTDYVSGKTTIPVYPANGMEYINRLNIRAGMVETVIDYNDNSNVVDLFKNHGFTVWGGGWNFPVDWQHFQVSREQAETLASLSYEEGVKYFDTIAKKRVVPAVYQPQENIE